MIDLIRDLVEFLSQDSLAVEDVVARVGTITHDPGGLMPIVIRPALAGVQEADLARDPDNGLPYVLTIRLADDAALTTTMLRQVFGEYTRLRTDRHQPPQVIFYPPDLNSRWEVAIIATLQSAHEPFDDQQISSLAFRRERSSS